ncbi:MAG: DUF512 domain-containing protein, partial [Wujia sp.]
NEKEIEDIFDYQFLVNDEYLEILIEKADGEPWLLEVEKDYDEDLGMSFDESLMDEYRSCYNKCVFCFIDQNPPGMRETIYFKDDDTRLSFLQGNYVTLTNMKEKDIERIIEYKLAPINISVHTTNPTLRCEMLHNRFAGNVLKYIQMLYDAGIPMNAQIVLCKGLNDGEELKKTISDLLSYAPVIESLSVVPVGLSKYRDGLCRLESFTKEDAQEVIAIIEGFQQQAMEKHGIHFVQASDEWYITAGYDLPEEERYDGYIQLENGVGMTRLFIEEAKQAVSDYLEEHAGKPWMKERNVSTVTGMIAYPYVCEVANLYKKAAPNLNLQVFPIRNDFFGEKITVTGLLTGQDIVKQLEGKDLGEALILPSQILKADEPVFLDDMTVAQLQNALHLPVIIVQSSAVELLKKIMEMEKDNE